jgi:hypothetical protein
MVNQARLTRARRPVTRTLALATAVSLAVAGCTSTNGVSTVAATSSAASTARSSGSTAGSSSTVRVTISGGLDPVAGDNGRPIVLVAGLLGVAPEVFRQAFSGVTPASPADGPTTAEAQTNKAALLAVLSPYGITNDQLDQASNTYRYNASTGELWPHTAATAVAIVTNGVVTAIKVTSGGSGYTSAPTITLSNGRTATATLAYGQDAATNGRIAAITLT